MIFKVYVIFCDISTALQGSFIGVRKRFTICLARIMYVCRVLEYVNVECFVWGQRGEPTDSSEEGNDGGGEVYSEWQAELVKKMKGVGLGFAERSPTLTKSRSSPALGSISSRDASQTLWDSKVLESRLPNGFYSVIPVRTSGFLSIYICISSIGAL